MTERDELIKRLAAAREAGNDPMAEQMRARQRARVMGETVPPLHYAGYEDPQLIGQGGMGLVYKARDPDLERTVAIKLVRHRDKPHADLRLRREAQAMARVVHTNIVQVYEAGRLADGQVFVVMQFVAGQDLRAWCQAAGRPWRAVRAMFCQAGRGLAAAHAAGIVHRDFKPQNVLIDEHEVARVTDFGLADVQLRTDGLPGTTGGTLPYAAPECLDGEAGDARCDQFSFCVALYEALFVHPFLRAGEFAVNRGTPGEQGVGSTRTRGLDQELRRRILVGEVAPPPADHSVPKRVLRALRRGLRGDPNERFPDMPQLLAALEDEPWPRRRSGILIAGLGVGLVVALARPFTAEGSCAVGPALVRDAAAEREVELSFKRAGVPMASERARSVNAGLAEYSQALTEERERLCEDRRASSVDVAVLDGRARCLDDAQRKLVATADSFAAADARRIEQMPAIFAALPRPEDCRLDQNAACRLTAPDLASVAVRRGLEIAWTAELRGDYGTATTAARQAAEQAERLGLKGATLVARQHLGRLLFEQEQLDAAAVELLAARDMALELDCTAQAADALEQLTRIGSQSPGIALTLVDDWSRTQDVLADRTEDPWRIAAAANTRGLLQLHRHGDLDAAERWFRVAFDQRKEATRVLQRIDLAYTTANLGNVEAERGDWEHAATYARSAQFVLARALGPEHPLAARFGFNVGMNALDRNDLVTARQTFTAAEILARKGGASGSLLADIVRALALVAEREGNFEEAAARAREAWSLADRVLAPTDRQRGEFMAATAAILGSAGRDAEAWALLHRALRETPADASPGLLADVWQQIAAIEIARGEHAAALDHAEKALALFNRDEERDPALLPHIEFMRAEALIGVGRSHDAIAPLRRALAEWSDGPPVLRVNAVWSLAQILIEQPDGAPEACSFAARAIADLPERTDSLEFAIPIKKFLLTHHCANPDGEAP